jgi:NodT family efflux transporter outer membrane factor (OMF) lipoprotein
MGFAARGARRVTGRRQLGAALRGIGTPLFVTALWFSGCALGPDFTTPDAELNDEWMAAEEPVFTGEPADPREWWKVFNDPVLDDLVDRLLSENLTLQQAALRMYQARARRSAVWMLTMPARFVSGAALHVNESETVMPDVDVTIPPSPITIPAPEVSISDSLEVYELNFDAVWELDLWGKNRRKVEAADAQFLASMARYDDVLVSLIAELAATYIRYRTLEQRIAITERNIEIQRGLLERAERRHADGVGPEFDVHLLRSLLANTQAWLPALQAAHYQAQNSICVMLGQPPHDLDEELGGGRAIPTAPAEVPLGIPADLLRRRPDVRRVEQLVAAQTPEIGIAKSNLLPRFSLLGSIGLASSHSGDLFESDSVQGAYGGIFQWDIFFWPGHIANIRVQDAQLQELIERYRLTVLRAAAEVENSCNSFLRAQERVALYTEGVDASRRAVRVSEEEYGGGDIQIASILAALDFLRRQEDQVTTSQGDIALSLVAVYKALGGGWEIRGKQSPLREKTIKEMEERTNWEFFYKPPNFTAQDEGGET